MPRFSPSVHTVQRVLRGNRSVGSYVAPRDDVALSVAVVKMAYGKVDVTDRCREFALNNYSVERVVKEYVDLYSSLN